MTLNIPDHWRYLLEGFGEADGGDVISREGEVLGTWGMINGAIYTFTPDGSTEPLIVDPFLGSLCSRVAQWQESRER